MHAYPAFYFSQCARSPILRRFAVPYLPSKRDLFGEANSSEYRYGLKIATNQVQGAEPLWLHVVRGKSALTRPQ